MSHVYIEYNVSMRLDILNEGISALDDNLERGFFVA